MIVPLDSEDARDPIRCGAKASRLAQLLTKGHAVPAGFVLTAGFFDKVIRDTPAQNAWASLHEALAKGHWPEVSIHAEAFRTELRAITVPDGPLRALTDALHHAGIDTAECAVRSSARAEDLVGASFAGQFETKLGPVGAPAVCNAALECLASMAAPNTMVYRRSHDIRDIGGAILVQRLVAADAAGVVFSVDPRDGSRDVAIVEAVRGLGDALVSGRVSPDRWVVTREDLRASRTSDAASPGEPAIDDEHARRIARLAFEVESHIGGAADVEWALEDDRLFLLQARPVTTSGAPTPPEDWIPDFQTRIDPRYPLYSRGNIGEVAPGCITPLGWSFAVPTLEHAFRAFSEQTHTLPPMGPEPVVIGTFYYRLYLNVSAFVAMAERAPGASRDSVYEELVGPVDKPTPRFTWRDLRPARLIQAGRVLSAAIGLHRRNDEDLAAVRESLEHDRLRLEEDPPSRWELRRFLTEPLLTSTVNEATNLHIRFSNGATSSYQSLKLLCAEYFGGRADARAAQLISGIAELGRDDPADDLHQMAQRIVNDPSLRALLEQHADDDRLISTIRRADASPHERELSGLLDTFLERHGHRGMGEIDLARPIWRDEPGRVIGMLRGQLDDPGETPSARVQRQQQQAQAARDEAFRSLSKRRADKLRRAVETASRYVVLRESTKDVVMRGGALTRTVLDALRRALVREHRLESADDFSMLRREELLAIIEGDLDPKELKALARRRRQELRWAQSIRLPKVLDGAATPIASDTAPSVVDGQVLPGISVCGGCVEGPARVVTDADELASLQPGEVLVALVTDLAWTPYFPRASALVVEVGGLLSHGSIVAREYGLTAVVGVQGATEVIRTGDHVRVDGDASCVQVLESAGNE